MSKLKPCPFCGSENVEYTDAFEGPGCYVICYGNDREDCGATLSLDGGWGFLNQKEAAEAWNRRVK